MIITPDFVDSELPLADYPRPQLKRDSYFPLNGEWDYALTDSAALPSAFDGKITVPYCPESKLSGVGRVTRADDFLHYRRLFTLPDGFVRGRVLLNVGACDQVCEAFVNGTRVGGHAGGYLPFTFDITAALRAGENELSFVVTDDAASPIYGRGKQRYDRGGIWYTPVSGLWQSVWLESVPEAYIKKIKITPDTDAMTFSVRCETSGDGRVRATLFDGEQLLAEASGSGGVTLDGSACRLWSPDSPELYRLVLTFGEDRVESYCGMRRFSLVRAGGRTLFALNGKPIFHNGLLDQGYRKDGIYTPAANAELYAELRSVKALGFNMLRKHIKTEPALWYYYCDTLGILVWQDMINGGGRYSELRIKLCPFVNLHIDDKNYKKMKRDDTRSRKQYMSEAYGLIDALYNVVSLCLWTPFNEAWGQFDAAEVCERLRSVDPTRLYDHASGWQDKGGGDVKSRHIYFRKARLRGGGARALALTEFGGYSLAVAGHTPSPRLFGYKKFASAAALTAALSKLYRTEIVPLIEKAGLCGAVYTQLADVEDEVNGLFTYDGLLKPDADAVREFNAAVYAAFARLYL